MLFSTNSEVTCTLLNDVLNCNGTIYEKVPPKVTINDEVFWIYLIGYAALTLGAGLMSGLTLGFMSLDALSLEVLINAGGEKEPKYATRVLPLVRRHHLLLVTLLLCNAVCVEAMPIFMDRISNPITAILVSVTAVLFFGEIIPQAICKRYGLAIGYYAAPLVYLMMALTIIVAFPIAKLLDCVFGHDTSIYYKRNQLKALVDLHGPQLKRKFDRKSISQSHRPHDVHDLRAALEHNAHTPTLAESRSEITLSAVSICSSGGGGGVDDYIQETAVHTEILTSDEVLIIKGALDLTNKVARDAMVSLPSVFMISSKDLLDEKLSLKILTYAHSRIPIFKGSERRMIQGVLLAKMLLFVDPHTKFPLQRLMDDPKCFKPMPYVTESTPLYDLLNLFQTGRTGHMAVVVRDDITEEALSQLEQLYEVRDFNAESHDNLNAPPVVGIITLEDVIEQLIQEPIEDESDIYRREVCRRMFHKQRMRRLATTVDMGNPTVMINRRQSTCIDLLKTHPTSALALLTNRRVEGSSNSNVHLHPSSANQGLNDIYFDNESTEERVGEQVPLLQNKGNLHKILDIQSDH